MLLRPAAQEAVKQRLSVLSRIPWPRGRCPLPEGAASTANKISSLPTEEAASHESLPKLGTPPNDGRLLEAPPRVPHPSGWSHLAGMA